MTFPSLTEDDIQEHTAGGSFERGRAYFEDGAVQSLKQTGENILEAQIQGSDVHPYLVTVEFDADRVTDVKCTCPYYSGTWCKHIVATLLKVLNEDEVPKSEPAAVAELVAGLDRDELVALIERLVEHDPRLLDQIEREQTRLTGSAQRSGDSA